MGEGSVAPARGPSLRRAFELAGVAPVWVGVALAAAGWWRLLSLFMGFRVARLLAAPEWPFGAPALRRLALYLLIPLASWSGGALVERLVDTLLD